LGTVTSSPSSGMALAYQYQPESNPADTMKKHQDLSMLTLDTT